MRIVRDGDAAGPLTPSVAAVGVFDGLHRGHQALIAQLREIASRDGLPSTVVTFDPLPALVLAPAAAPRVLATLDQRLEGLAALGVDQTRVLTFDAALARESARDFVARVLVGELGVRCVVVGEDFRFGHDREGSVELLREVGARRGFDVAPAPLAGDGERWSSTAVRRALEDGDLGRARDVLGRPFTLRGRVVHGDQRGRALGFPTANLALDPVQQLPAEGVYAGVARVGEGWFPAAISVGTRPHYYDDGELLVEAYLVDFAGDLYATSLDVAFLSRLRGQSAFASEDDLRRQIDSDVSETLGISKNFSPDDVRLLRWEIGQRR